MPLSDYTPIAAQFVAHTVTRLRVGTHGGDQWNLARQYRGMSDHGLADIGFCRTQIDLQVFAERDRR